METKEKIRRYLAAFKISQEAADTLAGVPPGRTFSYVSGRSKQISSEYLRALGLPNGVGEHWFTDGIDDWPGSRDGVPRDIQTIPIVGSLPMVAGAAPISVGEVYEQAHKSHALSVYYLVGEDLEPTFHKGDLVLIASDSGVTHAGPIRLVEHHGIRDLRQVARSNGQLVCRNISDEQGNPPTDWKSLGVVVRVRRPMAAGLTVIWDNETGITPAMMTTA